MKGPTPLRLRRPFLYSADDHPESFVAAKSSYRFVKPARLTAIIALLGLGLASCGKYGPLEPPPDLSAPPKPANSNQNGVNALSKPSIPPIVPPKQQFFLDFMLK
jgi:predicted small lipoprotein YifL